MTSLRYSNDKTDSKDFIRSFLAAVPFSIIALIVLFSFFVLPVSSYVTSPEFRQMGGPKNIISYFGEETFIASGYIQVGMVMCGFLTAVTLFLFMFSKKSVNVYFSMGITRTRLYLNRIISGVLAIGLAVLIPTAITLIINIRYFGSSSFLFNVFFFEFLSLFTSGLAGFAIGSLASTVSGSLVEAAITCGTLSFIPFFIGTALDDVKTYILKGYSYDVNSSEIVKMFSPFTFMYDMNYQRDIDMGHGNPIGRFTSMVKGKTVPKELAIDFDILAPVIFWIIVSMVFIALGFVLMNKRKAENSNSFGKFYVSSAINGTAVYSFVLLAITDAVFSLYYSKTKGLSAFYNNFALCLFVLLIALAIAFLLGMLIIRRNIKATVRQLPVLAFLLSLTIFGFVFISSEYFGTYNKLPATSEIASVSFDIHDSRGMFNYFVNLSDDAFSSSDAGDIKLAAELFEKIRKDENKDNEDMTANLGFCFTLKDKTVIKRSFSVYSPELFEYYKEKAYESKFNKDLLKTLLIEDVSNEGTENEGDYLNSYSYTNGYEYASDVSDVFEKGKYKSSTWYYAGSSSMFNEFDSQTNSVTADPIEDSAGLCEALYKDLIKLSYDKVYHNTSRPLGVLSLSATDAEYADGYYVTDFDRMIKETDYVGMYGEEAKINKLSQKYNIGCYSSGVYIYPEMTETIKFLKANGYIPLAFNGKVKEIYIADSKLSLANALDICADKLLEKDDNFKEYSYYFGENKPSYYFFFNESFSSLQTPYFPYINNAVQENNSYKETTINLLTKAFENAGVKLNKVTDKKKAQQIVSKSVPFIENIKNDNGRYIYIVYDNGVISEEYLPSVNVGVLK